MRSSNASEVGFVGLNEKSQHELEDDRPTKHPGTPEKGTQTNPELNIVSPAISLDSKHRAKARRTINE